MNGGEYAEQDGDCQSWRILWIEVVVRVAGVDGYVSIFPWHCRSATGRQIWDSW